MGSKIFYSLALEDCLVHQPSMYRVDEWLESTSRTKLFVYNCSYLGIDDLGDYTEGIIHNVSSKFKPVCYLSWL